MNEINNKITEINNISQLIAEKITSDDFIIDSQLEQQSKAIEALIHLCSAEKDKELLSQMLEKIAQFNQNMMSMIKDELHQVKASLLNINKVKLYVNL